MAKASKNGSTAVSLGDLKVLDDLRYRHISDFPKALRALKPPDVETAMDMSPDEFHGVCILAAARAGWFGDVDAEAVEEALWDATGADVKALADEVWAAKREAMPPSEDETKN